MCRPWPRIAPGTFLDLFTEDCFAGNVRSEKDLVSEVCEFPFLNPQTGPFYGFSELDAYQFATQTVESPLANVCATNYACVAEIRNEWLPARETHRGLHTRLRETAAALPRDMGPRPAQR